MYKIAEAEVVLCPYNTSHVVSKLRIQRHIIKCKKNHPDVNLSTCFYNYTHRLKPEDMLEHYKVCPQKARVEGARYYESYPCDVSVKSSQAYFNNNWNTHSANRSQMNSLIRNTAANKFVNSNKSETDSVENNEETKENFQQSIKSTLETDSEDEDENDELEPLPLPKTTSKAFTCAKKSPSPSPSVASISSRGFGRGRNFLRPLSPKPERTTDHLLPVLKDSQDDLQKKEKMKRFFVKNPSCSELSEEFDDCTTLRSEDIKSDEIDFNGFILKDFDKYVKI